MTRKHYVLIANNLKSALRYISNEKELFGFKRAVYCLAESFSEDNPRFNQERFYNAVYADYDKTVV